MNSKVRVVLAVIMTLGLAFGPAGSLRPAAAETTVITLTIGNPNITVNGVTRPIDASGTIPVIVGGRTLLPIRAVVEGIGGTIEWNAATRTVTIAAGAVTMSLSIGNRMATVNGITLPIDPQNATVVPFIIAGRTMLPLRFVGEQLGGTVDWNPETRTATLTFAPPAALTAPSLLEPMDGSLSTSTTITFRWTPVETATSYSLSVSSEGKEVYRGTSTTTTLIPSSAVFAAGQYSWTVTAVRGATTGPASLAKRFVVRLPLSPADIVKKATPSVVEVMVEYADGRKGVAAAFAIDPAGVLVTTYEIIKGAISAVIVLGDGSQRKDVRVLGYDPVWNVTVLRAAGSAPIPALALAVGQSAQMNQEVVMVGPVVVGIPQFTVSGVVNAVGTGTFSVRGAAEDAVEGAPILDAFGDVLGMVTTNIVPATGTFPATFAASIRAIQQTASWTVREVTEREGTGLQALDAPPLAEPASEATIGTLTPSFRWNAVTGATRYQFWIGEGRNATGDGLFSLFGGSTSVTVAAGNLKPGTVYTWAVRAGNDNGWGPWSPDRMFTTSSSIVQPPTPTVLEPLDGTTVKSAAPMLFWTPLQGARQYYVWIGLSDSDDDTVYMTSSPSASVLIPAGVLTSGTTYVWTVRVENSSQISSLWSHNTSFTLRIPSGIGVTSQISPAPDELITTLNPTFSWQAVPGATRYDLVVDKGTNESKVYEVAIDGTSWTIPVGFLKPGTIYRWYVIAGNAAGWSKTGDVWNWSLDREFTVGTNAVATLVAPRLLQPVDKAVLTTLQPTLSWQTVTAAAYYRVFIGIGPDDKHLEQVYSKIVYPKAGDTQQLAVIPGTLQAGTTYWWRVLAASGENSVWSDFRTFTTAP